MTNADRVLHVIGHGRAEAAPESAQLVLAVVARNALAGLAFSQVSDASVALQQSLGACGVAAKDIHTDHVSLQSAFGYGGPDTPPPSFEGRLTLTVRCAELSRLEEILSTSASNGSVEIQHIAYQVNDPASLEDRAWQLAVADGVRRAQLLAAASGLTLAGVVSLDGAGVAGPTFPGAYRAMSAESSMPSGELASEAQVRMTFALVEGR